jgi:N-carbamoylputrescine amidase
MKDIKTIKVAALQLKSQHRSIRTNHEHAFPFIEQAVQAGAQLVVLPELFTTGYVPNPMIWDAAEPQNGVTLTWLKQTSKKFCIYLGAGLLDTDGKDFYNSFVLCDPNGKEAGRVSKIETESYIFKRTAGSHVIETPLGKIGVGICADNQMVSFLNQMAVDNVDLMLMPHGWPTPCKTNQQVHEEDILDHQERTKRLPGIYAERLGVPAVFVNGVGSMARMIGLLGRFMDPEIFRLEGRSRIVDSDGTLAGELGSDEGVLISTVTLDPARKRYSQPESYDGWLLPGNAISRKVIIPFDVSIGQIWYRLTPLRKKKAKEILTRSKTNNH